MIVSNGRFEILEAQLTALELFCLLGHDLAHHADQAACQSGPEGAGDHAIIEARPLDQGIGEDAIDGDPEHHMGRHALDH